MRQIVMVGFLQAQNYTNLVSSCRHPACVPTVMPQSTTDTSEASSNRANFTCFFDDRLAMPDRFGGNHAHTVHYGIRCVKMDPVAVLMTMGTATEQLGQACCEASQRRLWIHLHMRVPTPKIKAHNRSGQEVADQNHLP